MLGFTKLTELHNQWIKDMITSKKDKTLQASRGTYKTTCDSIALALIMILLPNKRTMFMRKTDNDVKEVIKQVQKILQDPHTAYFVQVIYGVQLKLTVQSATEVSTNLTTDIKGTSQLVGIGTQSSLTGKHFDSIFTDDIVNVQDRLSKAERDRTKLVYQELQNIKNRGGRIYNTGTPWHQEDAFTLMPDAEKFDCYHPLIKNIIITDDELAIIKDRMVGSLFAANYELRFVASEDVIFTHPQFTDKNEIVEQGIMHLDSAFYGEDYTAWTIVKQAEGKLYVYGKLSPKSVEDCYGDIVKDWEKYKCTKLFTEDNADKGLIAKELRKLGLRVTTYHENQNKYMKIVTYLKAYWEKIIFVNDTDKAYINQICDFSENAPHDDAPDSLASMVRRLYGKEDKPYEPIFM